MILLIFCEAAEKLLPDTSIIGRLRPCYNHLAENDEIFGRCEARITPEFIRIRTLWNIIFEDCNTSAIFAIVSVLFACTLASL